MPNHVANRVLLHGQSVEDCRKYLIGRKGVLSFEVLLPLPLNEWPGSVGPQHEKAFPGNHLDSARRIWGTKWDAYGGPTVEQASEGVLLNFQTAWNHPRGWVCAIFNTLLCPITAKWISEGDNTAHIETYEIDKSWGPQWAQRAATADERREMYIALWGCTPEEMAEA